MIKSKVEKYFDKNLKAHALFLFDENGSFEEEVRSLDLGSIRLIVCDHSFFKLKRNLYSAWANDKVFLYFKAISPHKSKKYLEFPLLDLLEANSELVMDDEESFLEEFGLNRSQKNIVKKYIKELQYSSVQEVCRPILVTNKLDEISLQQGLISAFLKFGKISSWESIIAKTLLLAKPEKEADWKRFWRKLSENGLTTIFTKKISYFFGTCPELIDQPYLVHLLQKIRYNQITHWIQEAHRDDPYRELKIKDKKQLTSVFQLIQEGSQHYQINGRLKENLDWAGLTIHGSKLIEIYGPEADYGLLNSEMAWMILSSQSENVDFSPKPVIQKLEKIALGHDFEEEILNAYNFFIRLGEMIYQINSIASYTLNKPEDYLLNYTIDWNRIDSSYRKAIQSFRNIQKIPEHFDLDKYYTMLNKRYDTHLEKSNREWLRCLKELNFDYKRINAPKQHEFFSREIEDAEVKTVVIISDALRYEAAKELLGVMHGDDKMLLRLATNWLQSPLKQA